MFDKLWDFVKKTGKKIVRFGMDKDQPIPEPRVGYNEYMRTHPEQKKAEAPVQKQEEKKLVHPVTKDEVAPLKNVFKDPKEYIRVMNKSAWGDEQWPALEELIRRESSFNPEAVNPSSGAFGLFQANPSGGQTPPKPDLQSQWNWGYNYIKNRYGTPQNALNFHDKNGWY